MLTVKSEGKMFTGIVEDIGKVIRVEKQRLIFETKLDDIKVADSIAVNGVCLTVVSVSNDIVVDISMETLKRTNLGLLKCGSFVNLERALRAGSRLGGHIVSGHIDSTAEIVRIKDEFCSSHNTKVVEVHFPSKLKKYIVEKGSVCVDGVSLTVASVEKDSFTVVLVPHTINNTTLQYKKVRDIVNLEVDIIAKYVESVLTDKKDDSYLYDKLKKFGFMGERTKE